MRVKIYSLLCAGHYPAQIARLLKISQPAIAKHIKKLLVNGLIERTGTKPAFYRAKSLSKPLTSLVGDNLTTGTKKPLFLPHKLGASFILIGKLPLKKDSRGIATIKELTYTIRFGKAKAVIWLKAGFTGTTINEILANAKESITAIAKKYEQTYGITLTLDRYYEGSEWVLNDKPASSELSDKADIKPSRIIAGTNFKFDDLTHPKYIEINTAQGYPEYLPEIHAKTLEYLLLNAPYLLKQLVESSLTINMRLETLEAELKKKGYI